MVLFLFCSRRLLTVFLVRSNRDKFPQIGDKKAAYFTTMTEMCLTESFELCQKILLPFRCPK